MSAFAGRGKRPTAWEIWNLHPEVPMTFTKLMDQPHTAEVEDAVGILEIFIVLLYDKTSSKNHIIDV